jgi:multimeric flavodoxin WrbA
MGMTKVLGISCSPRRGGNTEILIKEALKGAKKEGADVEFLSLIGRDIKPCNECRTCETTGVCSIKDDMQGIYGKILDAEGIILGAPIFHWSLCGQAKVLLDRTYALSFPRLQLANKVGGSIAVAGREGLMNGHMTFQQCFLNNHMILADRVSGLASEKGEILKDERAMGTAWEMGRQVVQLIKTGFKFPKEFDVPIYRHYIEKKPEK